MINISANAVCNYQAPSNSLRTLAGEAEEKARRAALAKSGMGAEQIKSTATPVILASVASSQDILPELPSEVVAIIASYGHNHAR